MGQVDSSTEWRPCKSRIFFKTALCDVIVIIIIYDTKNNTQEKKVSVDISRHDS